jgi:hypothetical protein
VVIERFFTFSLIEMARLPTVLNIGHLQRMIRKARDLKMALDGEGHKYQHGKPRFLVIRASKGPEEEWLMVGEGVGHFSDSSGRDLITDGYLGI